MLLHPHYIARSRLATHCAAAIIGIGLAGCQSDAPSAPSAVAQPTTKMTASAAQLDLARMGISDASTRLAPAIAQIVANAALNDALATISDAVDRRDAAALQRGLDSAHRAMEKIQAADGGSATLADLNALSLSLADVARLLAPADTTSTAVTTP